MMQRLRARELTLFVGLFIIFILFSGVVAGSLIEQQHRLALGRYKLETAVAGLLVGRLDRLILTPKSFSALKYHWAADCDKSADAVLEAQSEAMAVGFTIGLTPACFQFRLPAPVAGEKPAELKPLGNESLSKLQAVFKNGIETAVIAPGEWPGYIAMVSRLPSPTGETGLFVRAFAAHYFARRLASDSRPAAVVDDNGKLLIGRLPDNMDSTSPISTRIGTTNLKVVTGPSPAGTSETRFFEQVLALVILLSAAGSIIFGWAVRKLILEKLEALQRVARIYSKGRFSVRFRLAGSTPWEIADLGRAMNEMADSGAKQVRALQETAAEETRLLLELHHRVKNNFQVLESLLSLLKKGRDAADLIHLRFVEDNVRSMAVADRLAYGAHGMSVSIEELVGGVVDGLRTAWGLSSLQVRVKSSPALGTLDLDRAVALCLCLAVALPPYLSAAGDGGDPVNVAVEARDAGILHLAVTGSPPKEDLSPFLRRRLIQAYLHQLDAIPGSGTLFNDARAFSILIPYGEKPSSFR